MQPLAILFGAAFTAAVAFSFGAILLRSSCSDPAVRFVAGGGILMIGAVATAGAHAEWRIPKRPRLTRWLLLFVPFLILCFFNAMAPEISFDGSRDHLGLVSRYLREHGFHVFTGSLYAAVSQGVEMLYLFAFAFGRHSAVAMVHFTFLVALVWQIYAWPRRRGFSVRRCVRSRLGLREPGGRGRSYWKRSTEAADGRVLPGRPGKKISRGRPIFDGLPRPSSSAAAWDIAQAAEYKGWRLYQLP